MADVNKKEIFYAGLSTDGKSALFSSDAQLAATLKQRSDVLRHLPEDQRRINGNFNNQAVKGVIAYKQDSLEARIKELREKTGLEGYVATLETGLKELAPMSKILAEAKQVLGKVGKQSGMGKIGTIYRDDEVFKMGA